MTVGGTVFFDHAVPPGKGGCVRTLIVVSDRYFPGRRLSRAWETHEAWKDKIISRFTYLCFPNSLLQGSIIVEHLKFKVVKDRGEERKGDSLHSPSVLFGEKFLQTNRQVRRPADLPIGNPPVGPFFNVSFDTKEVNYGQPLNGLEHLRSSRNKNQVKKGKTRSQQQDFNIENQPTFRIIALQLWNFIQMSF